ncbi:MAG: hypothetical protein KBE25_02490 [Laribacter sp.]|nr:hypothetical protein [Laribacter sp.]MBP9527058.1 hypothetical protein [Laribacter sp.]MBP9608204.1 hypothetical protein [Laribacter sp.]
MKQLLRKPSGKINITSTNEAYASCNIDPDDLPNDFVIAALPPHRFGFPVVPPEPPG